MKDHVVMDVEPADMSAYTDLHNTCATQLPVEPLLRAVIACDDCPGIASLTGTVSGLEVSFNGAPSTRDFVYTIDFDAKPWEVRLNKCGAVGGAAQPVRCGDTCGFAQPTDSHSVTFTGGKMCSVGPRTTQVTFVGGDTLRILPSEPSTCRYEITVQTPLCGAA